MVVPLGAVLGLAPFIKAPNESVGNDGFHRTVADLGRTRAPDTTCYHLWYRSTE